MSSASSSLRNAHNLLAFSRWFAAFLVVISHVRHVLFADLKLVPHPGYLLKGFYFVTGFGDEAVVIFFVLSGLLVGGLSAEQWADKGFRPGAYFANRVSRIYTVLIPALFVGFLLDRIGLSIFDSGAIYSDAPRYGTSVLNFIIADRLDLATLFGNLFGMQHVLVSTFGSNGPLWSLANEWWYYLMFAVCGAALFGSSLRKVLAILCLVGFAILLPAKIVLWGLVWLLGVAIPLCVRLWRSRIPSLKLASGLLVACLCIVRLSHNQEAVNNASPILAEFAYALLLGFFFSVWVASVVVHLPESAKLACLWRGFNDRMAAFSFSVYLFHFPMMVFLLGATMTHTSLPVPQMQPAFVLFACFSGFTLFLYLYSYVCFWLFERHTPNVRQLLLRCFADSLRKTAVSGE